LISFVSRNQSYIASGFFAGGKFFRLNFPDSGPIVRRKVEGYRELAADRSIITWQFRLDTLWIDDKRFAVMDSEFKKSSQVRLVK
jgi:hypothetical protein